MTTKLDWEYQDRSRTPEYHATYKGLRLRAVHDDSPENPFEAWDCNWPVIVRNPDNRRDDFTNYDKAPGRAIDNVLDRFTDAQLVHDQIAIADVFGHSMTDLSQLYAEDNEPVKYCRDPDTLRGLFQAAIEDVRHSDRLEIYAALYTLLGIPNLCGQTTGYCQGDYAEILVVATPEAQKEFGNTAPTPEDLQGTIDLYGAWAWGDVYGYIVERVAVDEEDDEIEAEELDSCWGYYGSDFDKSGLEEQAMSAADHHAKEETPCLI